MISRGFYPGGAQTAAVWAAGIGVGAYVAGPTVLDVVNDWGTVTGILLGVLVLIAIGFEVRRRRLRAQRRAEP
jgi:membrane protein DedA with SNARE-associated domain